jgi:Flp pilus assembly protein TadG
MDAHEKNMARPGGVLRRFATFMRDRKGAAAVEFALIAPLLLTLYFVTMEVSQGIDTNKKVSRLGSMVADLVAQQPSITNTEDLDAIMRIGEAILQPYGRTRPAIEIAGIQLDKDGKATVAWSRKMVAGTVVASPGKGTPATGPAEVKIPETFLIRVSAQLGYLPVIAWNATERAGIGLLGGFDRIPMDEIWHVRPRMTNTITCADC